MSASWQELCPRGPGQRAKTEQPTTTDCFLRGSREGATERGPWNSQGVKSTVTERKAKDPSEGSAKTQAQIGSSPNTQDVDVAWPVPLSEGKLVMYFNIQVPCFIFSRLLCSLLSPKPFFCMCMTRLHLLGLSQILASYSSFSKNSTSKLHLVPQERGKKFSKCFGFWLLESFCHLLVVTVLTKWILALLYLIVQPSTTQPVL